MAVMTIRHVTRYRYAKPVRFGEHQMMFRPRESFDQHVLESSLVITPRPAFLRYQHDVFGNCIGIARFNVQAGELRFESINRLEHTPELALDQRSAARDDRNSYPFAYRESDLPDVHSSMLRCDIASPDPVPAWARRFLDCVPRVDAMRVLTMMTHAIHDEFDYAARLAGPPQSPAETLEKKSGTCRDFAVLMMDAARYLGLAVRFVSGYLFVPPKGVRGSGRHGGGNTHAWVRVFLPDGGWVEFDPTNGLVGNRDLIRVAVVREPSQALPLCGTWIGDTRDYLGMDVDVQVTEEKTAARDPERVMLIRGGFNLGFDCVDSTPIILMIRLRPERAADLVEPEKITLYPEIPATTYQDGFGNVVTRLVAPPGRLSIWNRFVISDSGLPDEMPVNAAQHAVEALPDDVLVYLMGSRYCDTQKLSDFAWSQFGRLAKGWPLLRAIVQYTHERIKFDYMQARNDRTAWEAYRERIGVCRDYAHLAVTLCRCMNIPARYCTGYLGDIGVPPDPAPMDFSAWFEVFLGGRWFTMDARHNKPRIGRILMACGRDAADVAISNSFGHNTLAEFTVITEEVPAGSGGAS